MLAGMGQQHERGLGGWHAEWIALPELAQLAAGALAQTADTIAGLEVDAERMRRNLDVTNGLIMAEEIGRAHVELQSLMRISYAVFCLKKKKNTNTRKKH